MSTAEHDDIMYMQRCIDLAKKGIRDTLSNPMVGCVIVHQNKVIGEGYHKKFGDHHAEINAINSIGEKDKHLIPESVMYVSLEPCSHVGKTPACAHRIVKEGIKNVIIGTIDPNPVVAGRGIAYLIDNGVKVKYPVYETACIDLIKKFESNLQLKPYVILKWAQSEDNFISVSGSQCWLSNEYSRILTHKWRSETEGILIGKNTAMIDDPSLDVRFYSGPSPVRILLDTNLNTPIHQKILSDGRPTIVINTLKEEKKNEVTYLSVSDNFDINGVLKRIFAEGINSILVEGGAKVLNSFIAANCWNEARIIKTNVLIKEGIRAPEITGRLKETINLGNDKIYIIQNK